MAAINVTTSSGNSFGLEVTHRAVVRDTTGIPYVVVENETDNAIDVWMGNSTTPTSFSQQDAANRPTATDYGHCSCAIDSSGIIHIVYMYDNGKSSQARYVTFNTSTNVYAGDVAIIADVGNDPGSIGTMFCDVAIDSNDIPHVVHSQFTTNMGTDYYSCHYNNRIGGAWNASSVFVEGSSNNLYTENFAIDINASNIPVITYRPDADLLSFAVLSRATGNANDATSFTLIDLDTSTGTSAVNMPTIAVDSGGDVWVAYQDSDNSPLVYEGTTDRSPTSTNMPFHAGISLAHVGTNTYLLYEDTLNDIGYDVWNGSAWAGFTSLDAGTFENPKFKFGSYVNFGSDGVDYGNGAGIPELDYVYSNGTDVFFNTITFAAATSIKTINGLAKASVKQVNGLATASVKTWNGLA